MSACNGIITIIKRDGTEGGRYSWEKQTCIFGRDIDADIRIHQPAVAFHHCILEKLASGEVSLTNLSEEKGTLINGQIIQSSTVLQDDAVITVGDRKFRFFYPAQKVASPNKRNSSGRRSSVSCSESLLPFIPQRITSHSKHIRSLSESRHSTNNPNYSPVVPDTPRPPEKRSVRKSKRVSFGPNLSPETYDKSLPPSTPLRKGAAPPSSKDSMNVIAEELSPEIRSKKRKGTSLTPVPVKKTKRLSIQRTDSASLPSNGVQSEVYNFVNTNRRSPLSEKVQRRVSVSESPHIIGTSDQALKEVLLIDLNESRTSPSKFKRLSSSNAKSSAKSNDSVRRSLYAPQIIKQPTNANEVSLIDFSEDDSLSRVTRTSNSSEEHPLMVQSQSRRPSSNLTDEKTAELHQINSGKRQGRYSRRSSSQESLAITPDPVNFEEPQTISFISMSSGENRTSMKGSSRRSRSLSANDELKTLSAASQIAQSTPSKSRGYRSSLSTSHESPVTINSDDELLDMSHVSEGIEPVPLGGRHSRLSKSSNIRALDQSSSSFENAPTTPRSRLPRRSKSKKTLLSSPKVEASDKSITDAESVHSTRKRGRLFRLSTSRESLLASSSDALPLKTSESVESIGKRRVRSSFLSTSRSSMVALNSSAVSLNIPMVQKSPGNRSRRSTSQKELQGSISNAELLDKSTASEGVGITPNRRGRPSRESKLQNSFMASCSDESLFNMSNVSSVKSIVKRRGRSSRISAQDSSLPFRSDTAPLNTSSTAPETVASTHGKCGRKSRLCMSHDSILSSSSNTGPLNMSTASKSVLSTPGNLSHTSTSQEELQGSISEWEPRDKSVASGGALNASGKRRGRPSTSQELVLTSGCNAVTMSTDTSSDKRRSPSRMSASQDSLLAPSWDAPPLNRSSLASESDQASTEKRGRRSRKSAFHDSLLTSSSDSGQPDRSLVNAESDLSETGKPSARKSRRSFQDSSVPEYVRATPRRSRGRPSAIALPSRRSKQRDSTNVVNNMVISPDATNSMKWTSNGEVEKIAGRRSSISVTRKTLLLEGFDKNNSSQPLQSTPYVSKEAVTRSRRSYGATTKTNQFRRSMPSRSMETQIKPQGIPTSSKASPSPKATAKSDSTEVAKKESINISSVKKYASRRSVGKRASILAYKSPSENQNNCTNIGNVVAMRAVHGHISKPNLSNLKSTGSSWADVVKRKIVPMPNKTQASSQPVILQIRKRQKGPVVSQQFPKTPREKYGGAPSTGHVHSPATFILRGKRQIISESPVYDGDQSTMSPFPPTPVQPSSMIVSPLESDVEIDVGDLTMADHRVSEGVELKKNTRQRKSVDYQGIRSIMKTPLIRRSMDLRGVKEIVQMPRQRKSASLLGVRTLLKTPKANKRSLDLKGVKELAKTPKIRKSADYEGVRALMRIPKPDKSPDLRGVKELSKTPKMSKATNYIGVRNLLKTPVFKTESPNYKGIKEITKSPKQRISVSYVGVRNLVKTQKTRPSVDYRGIKEMKRTPKKMRSPDYVGVRDLVRTPKTYRRSIGEMALNDLFKAEASELHQPDVETTHKLSSAKRGKSSVPKRTTLRNAPTSDVINTIDQNIKADAQNTPESSRSTRSTRSRNRVAIAVNSRKKRVSPKKSESKIESVSSVSRVAPAKNERATKSMKGSERDDTVKCNEVVFEPLSKGKRKKLMNDESKSSSHSADKSDTTVAVSTPNAPVRKTRSVRTRKRQNLTDADNQELQRNVNSTQGLKSRDASPTNIQNNTVELKRDKRTRKQTKEAIEPKRSARAHKQTEKAMEPKRSTRANRQTDEAIEPKRSARTHKQTKETIEPQRSTRVHKHTEESIEPKRSTRAYKHTEETIEPERSTRTHKQTGEAIEPKRSTRADKQTEETIEPKRSARTRKRRNVSPVSNGSKNKKLKEIGIEDKIERMATDLEMDASSLSSNKSAAVEMKANSKSLASRTSREELSRTVKNSRQSRRNAREVKVDVQLEKMVSVLERDYACIDVPLENSTGHVDENLIIRNTRTRKRKAVDSINGESNSTKRKVAKSAEVDVDASESNTILYSGNSSEGRGKRSETSGLTNKRSNRRDFNGEAISERVNSAKCAAETNGPVESGNVTSNKGSRSSSDVLEIRSTRNRKINDSKPAPLTDINNGLHPKRLNEGELTQIPLIKAATVSHKTRQQSKKINFKIADETKENIQSTNKSRPSRNLKGKSLPTSVVEITPNVGSVPCKISRTLRNRK